MAKLTKPLTNTEVKQSSPRDKEYNLSDGHGLALRIKPNGSKLWIMNYQRPVTKKRANLSQHIEAKRIYSWMNENSTNKKAKEFRSTRAIASYNNLTEDRVRYLCSTHKKIYLSTGEKEDVWSIHSRKHSTFFVD